MFTTASGNQEEATPEMYQQALLQLLQQKAESNPQLQLVLQAVQQNPALLQQLMNQFQQQNPDQVGSCII